MVQGKNVWLMGCKKCDLINEEKKVKPHSFGKYKVMQTINNYIIFKCVKCRHTFKAKMIGSFLDETDFDPFELEFKQEGK